MDSTPPPSPDLILASLCNRLQELGRLAPDRAGREQLAAALAEAQELRRVLGLPQGGWSVDHRAFDGLLDLAGALSGELLAQLHRDLQEARDRLGRAIPGGDWGDVRAVTHTLVALAGSMGADRLQRLSGALNTAAHRQDRGALAELGAEVLAGLDHLIAFVTGRIAAVTHATPATGQI